MTDIQANISKTLLEAASAAAAAGNARSPGATSLAADDRPRARKPHLSIEPSSGFAALRLRELWHYRDLLFTLALRDVKLRYRQTALGVLWVIFQPLLGAFIFGFIFGRVAKLPTGGISYFVFAYAGLLAWNAFNGTLTKTSACVVGNAQLVSKVYFPRLILPLSTVFSTLIDFAVGLGLLGVLLAVYGINPGWRVLLLPVWLGLTILLAVGVGLFASALMVRFRDLQYVIPVVLQFWLYASPIAYEVVAIPRRFRWAYLLNPLASLLEGFRLSLIGVGTFHWYYLAYACVISVVVFVAGAIVFKHMERSFADVI